MRSSRNELLSLTPIIKSAARKAAGNDTALMRDIEQEAWVTALECAERHTGEKGASLATYAYNAIRLTAYHCKARHGAPVHVPKHATKHAWGLRPIDISKGSFRRGTANEGPADHMDILSADGASHLDVHKFAGMSNDTTDTVELFEIQTLVRTVIRTASPHADAVREVLLEDESVAEVAERHGINAKALARAVHQTKLAIARDEALRAIYTEK